MCLLPGIKQVNNAKKEINNIPAEGYKGLGKHWMIHWLQTIPT